MLDSPTGAPVTPLRSYRPPHAAEVVGRRGEKRMRTRSRHSRYLREWPDGTLQLSETHREGGRDGAHKRWHNSWSKVWGCGGHRGWNGSLKWGAVGDGEPAGEVCVSADGIRYGILLLWPGYSRKTQGKGSVTEDKMSEPATRDSVTVMMR